MSTSTVQVNVQINKTPEAVISYVADVRNRPLFLPSLKSISDINGDPAAVGTTWRWTWVLLGVEFEGTGRCLEHETGRRYSFTTEGGLSSKFTYQAESAGDGTSLTIDVEFEVPGTLLSRVGIDDLLEGAKKRDVDQVAQNLKVILEQ